MNKLKALLKTMCNVINVLRINSENIFLQYRIDLCIKVGLESIEVNILLFRCDSISQHLPLSVSG